MDFFSTVFVCTGNRFRSPLAAAFLRRLTAGLPVTVSSRGILQLNDSRALAEAIELAFWFGLDLSQHRAQRLAPATLEDADLVVGFEHAHVRHAVIDGGAQRTATFTLTELVALLDGAAPPVGNVVEGARRAVEDANRKREGGMGTSTPDLPDPYGRSWKAQCRIACEIREAVVELAGLLFGVTSTTGLPPLPDKLPRRRRVLRRAFTTR